MLCEPQKDLAPETAASRLHALDDVHYSQNSIKARPALGNESYGDVKGPGSFR